MESSPVGRLGGAGNLPGLIRRQLGPTATVRQAAGAAEQCSVAAVLHLLNNDNCNIMVLLQYHGFMSVFQLCAPLGFWPCMLPLRCMHLLAVGPRRGGRVVGLSLRGAESWPAPGATAQLAAMVHRPGRTAWGDRMGRSLRLGLPGEQDARRKRFQVVSVVTVLI